MSDRQSNFFTVCVNCKAGYSCCNATTPPVTFQRRRIIEEYLKDNELDVDHPFERTEYVFPRLVANDYCVFHDMETRKCAIHHVKPETCVAGPITFDINVVEKKIEWFIKMEKICPLAGVVYRDKQLLSRHLENAKREILRLVEQMPTQELQAVLTKDEPETFKIGEDNLEGNLFQKRKKNRLCR